MATVVVQQTFRHSTPPPSTISSTLNLNRNPSPVPNKHLPVCPAGPTPVPHPELPAAVPRKDPQISSILYPPDGFVQVSNTPPVYAIGPETLVAAVDHLASQPLPDPSLVFPWMHGLHPENQHQLGFLTNCKRNLRQLPKCWRGITLVKLGGDLTKARLKGAVSPDEVLSLSQSQFFMVDPREGLGIRNFQIQTAKLAPLSDIVVYAEDGLNNKDLLDVATRIACAQHDWNTSNRPGHGSPHFNTFILPSTFPEIEAKCPSLVAIDSRGQITGQVMDFFQWERFEMCDMSRASEISSNVWQGPTPDYLLRLEPCHSAQDGTFDLLVETSEVANIPGPRLLAQVREQLEDGPQRLEFPASGSFIAPPDGSRDVEDFVGAVRWIYYLAHPDEPENAKDVDGDIAMATLARRPRKVLIHCPDGYTESSLLTIAYFMFAEGVPAHEAWIRLHCEKKRNFFAYPCDVAFLRSIQARILRESPAAGSLNVCHLLDPIWFKRCDGSLPSRVLPYMYLGNLNHANNPQMLWALGIRRILSIGEPVTWSEMDEDRFGAENKLLVTGVQDNGIDPLSQEFNQCLEFIRKGKYDGAGTLVHCRVGVSRSATICIAEVMATLGLSFPRAYCYVRARRLNVIIQPHLRFVYELMKWEETQLQSRNMSIKRELEWPTVAREIALMNKPYSNR